MYCYVLFGESKDNHTKTYLYECSSNSESGDLVKVSIKNSTKIGLIKCVFDLNPMVIFD